MSKKRRKQRLKQATQHPRLTTPGVKMPVVSVGSHSHGLSQLFGQRLFLTLLILLLLISAFGVVYIRDYHRRLFMQQQTLSKNHNQLMMQWSKLLLEQTTLSNQTRVQQIAEQKLNMIVEPPKNIVMINL